MYVINESYFHYFLGGKGKGDPDPTSCCRYKHIAAVSFWDPTTCCDWRIIYICCRNNFNYTFWPIQ